MRLHRTPVRRRAGFTLIELMVVMAIIAVLVSLLASAVFSAFDRLWEVQCRQEITGMEGALKQFQGDFNNPGPPPSRIWLDSTMTFSTPPAGYTAAQVQQLGIDSQAYLRKVWPHIQGGIPWNSGVQGRSNNVILEGEEALVFWLGGAQDPTTGAFTGFSADTTNPMRSQASSPTIKRKGPYFQFVTAHVGTSPTGSGFPIYYDTYSTGLQTTLVGRPYLYYSSGKTANGYNAYATFGIGNDCKTVGNFDAYYQPGQLPHQYYHPDTFQIISAGKNQKYGAGGQWTGTNPTPISTPGGDDVVNFTGRKLSTPQ
jgi:prepilin-type N-terminal cleavage/methylation domain-containing protein